MYYFFKTKGAIGIIWAIIFWFVSSKSPQSHRFIGIKEKEYLFKETQQMVNIAENIVMSNHIFLSLFILIYLLIIMCNLE